MSGRHRSERPLALTAAAAVAAAAAAAVAAAAAAAVVVAAAVAVRVVAAMLCCFQFVLRKRGQGWGRQVARYVL